MSDNSPSVHSNGIIVYRASDIGGCVTRLAAARAGYEKAETKPKQAKVYQAGHNTEDWFFETNPQFAINRQLETRLEIIPGKIAVVGHVDAYTGEILEIKSQSGKEFARWTTASWVEDDLWIKYAWQISALMLGLPDRSSALLVRINRENKEISWHEIPRPFITVDQIVDKVLEVESLALEDKLVCHTPEYFCAYPYLHPAPEPQDNPELDRLAAHYLTLTRAANALKEEIRQVRDEIMVGLDSLPNETDQVLLLSGRTISRSTFTTKDHWVKGTEQTRLTVKETNDSTRTNPETSSSTQ